MKTRVIAKRLWQFFFSMELKRILAGELYLVMVRIVSVCDWTQRRRIWRWRQSRHLKLHLGSGTEMFGGWINIDGSLDRRLDLRLDLRRGLPLADESVQFIYTQHFLEHVDYYDDAPGLVAECYRVLEPGGAIRVGVPDIPRYIKAYLERDMEWARPMHPDLATPMEVLNAGFRAQGGHRFGYDAETLELLLRKAGFSVVYDTDWRGSRYPDLNRDTDWPPRRTCTLYVEAIK